MRTTFALGKDKAEKKSIGFASESCQALFTKVGKKYCHTKTTTFVALA